MGRARATTTWIGWCLALVATATAPGCFFLTTTGVGEALEGSDFGRSASIHYLPLAPAVPVASAPVAEETALDGDELTAYGWRPAALIVVTTDGAPGDAAAYALRRAREEAARQAGGELVHVVTTTRSKASVFVPPTSVTSPGYIDRGVYIPGGTTTYGGGYKDIHTLRLVAAVWCRATAPQAAPPTPPAEVPARTEACARGNIDACAGL